MADKPSRKQIKELSLHDPIVHNALTLHYRGDLTYEEALILAVASLSYQLEDCKRQATAVGNLSLWSPFSQILKSWNDKEDSDG